MTVPDEYLRRYPYADPQEYREAQQRRPRLESFITVSFMVPTRFTKPYQDMLAGWNFGHPTAWKLGDAPILMSESYAPMDSAAMALSGLAFIEVPQRYSIYRPDTHMVLVTTRKYRDALKALKERLS